MACYRDSFTFTYIPDNAAMKHNQMLSPIKKGHCAYKYKLCIQKQ
jgi:hypothetical protein